MELYAHYTATRTVKTLLITDSPCPARHAGSKQYTVKGKAEARKIAQEQGAKPWNF